MVLSVIRAIAYASPKIVTLMKIWHTVARIADLCPEKCHMKDALHLVLMDLVTGKVLKIRQLIFLLFRKLSHSFCHACTFRKHCRMALRILLLAHGTTQCRDFSFECRNGMIAFQ